MRAKIFDTRWLGAHGIGRFASELLKRMPEFSPIDISGSPSRPIEPIILARYLRVRKPRIFFSPGYNAPIGRPVPFVFCLHDLNHLGDDEPNGYLKRMYYEYIVRPSVLRADAIITVSEYSRMQICEWAGIANDRVANVANGVSAEFSASGAADSRAPYFLHVGGWRPNKNLKRVMWALATSNELVGAKLICVGRQSEDIRRLAHELRLENRVTLVNGVVDSELAKLYRGALALVFVSLREGFGLPIVEAMACGCPVITSRNGAMPEVAGSASLFVNPEDVDDIREKMEQIATNSSLRERLIVLGKSRACLFSWERTASRVREIVQRAEGQVK